MKRTLQLALLLALFLVCGRSAFAQTGFAAGQAFTYTPGGAFPAGGSIVTICTTGGTGTPCTPTVTLYQDSAASIPVANPLAACTSSPQIGCLDGYGNFSFYVAVAGAYTYTITSLSGLNPYGPVPIIAQANLPICATCVTSAASLTVNQPVVGGGSQAAVALATTFSSLTTICNSAQTWAIASAWVANAFITITGNCTLNLTNPLAGGNYVLVVQQGFGGSHTLTLGTGCTWKVSGGGGGAITPTTTAGAIDVLAFTYDGANCYANYNKNFN